ncbi:peptidase S8/S53 domain-containing protein [Paraphysoderma sedebokerense]|nr:peptidase S8/S53 domain-containing protein [Paraphysoderma sedebokerense]
MRFHILAIIFVSLALLPSFYAAPQNPGNTKNPGSVAKPGNNPIPNPRNTTTPVTPKKPGTPASPGNKTPPGNSTRPGNPTSPGNSTKPGNSTRPENPTSPGNSTKPGNSTTPGNATSGNVPLAPPVGLTDDSVYDIFDVLDGKKDFNYTYPAAAGEGVDIYFLDSGIYTEHSWFSGRASFLKNFVDDEEPKDLVSHGTNVASIAAAIARKSKILGIKVSAGTGGPEGGEKDGEVAKRRIISGLQYAVEQIKKSGRPSIINMSIKVRPFSEEVDAAFRNASSAGIPVFVSAGNDGIDACETSPSREPSVISVGNAALDNKKWTGESPSNYGSCVDIYAHGVNVTAAANTDVKGTGVATGTSQASPVAAGVAAILMSMGVPAKDLLNQLRQITNLTVSGDKNQKVVSMNLIQNFKSAKSPTKPKF